jgi:hypothetical protein
MQKKIFLACFLFIIIFMIPGCKSSNQSTVLHNWQYIDFRLFDPPDSILATADILGVYLYQPSNKEDRADIYIRLDMLDVKDVPDMDIYLAIDSQPGGSISLPIQATADIAWDWLIIISAGGSIEVLNSSGSNPNPLSVTILRDSLLETIEAQINLVAMDSKSLSVKVQCFTTMPGDTTVQDSTSVADIWQLPPPRLNVLIAFWNSFPAFTPAQSLRRWDGAHTGPLGGHHGLLNLLTTAKNHQVPIFLLDINNPVSLTALDYLKSNSLLKELQDEGILGLPDVGSVYPAKKPYLLPDELLVKILNHSQELRENFGFAPTHSLYSYLTTDQLNLTTVEPYDIIFIPTPQVGPLIEPHWLEGHLIIPIPSDLVSDGITKSPPPSADRNELGGQLVTAGLQSNVKHSIFIIGGSVPDSVWGDPQISRSGFQYLKSRPWIRLVSETDLLSLFNRNRNVNNQSYAIISAFDPDNHPRLNTEQSNLISELIQSPPTLASTIAWDTIFQLLSPAYPDYKELPDLRNLYWAQVYVFKYLAEWLESPGDQQTCGEIYLYSPTCTLASSNLFLVIDQLDGNILFAFYRDRGHFHQLIGPFSQLASGLRDPSLWIDQRGIKSEPSLLDNQSNGSQEPLQFETYKNSIILSNQETLEKIHYTLQPESILIQYNGNQSIKTPIYFSLDPWSVHLPKWSEDYHAEKAADGWRLWIDSSICMLIRTNGKIERYAFNKNQERMYIPENPDAEKKPDDYLPYPLMAGIFSSNQDIFVEISIMDSCLDSP